MLEFIINQLIMANKQQSVAANDTGPEQPDKTNPFDKLIASDQLTYLPNLYLRQYKAVDELVRLRQNYPEQRVILARPYTQWDSVLDQMRYRSRVVLEEKRFKVVQRAQTAKQLKIEVQRVELREEETYHFHRLTSSYLSEAVLSLFQQQGKTMEIEIKEEPKEEEQKAVVKKNQDDIFVQGGDDYYDLPEENNLLDDLLNDPIVEKKEEEAEHEQIFIEPISAVLAAKYAASKGGSDFEPSVSISRKVSLKRINESVRRRLRIKQEEEEQQGRSLSSATVFLSNLINTQAESKAKELIELPSRTQWLFTSERGRKKREQDGFQLRWSAQQLQKMEERNQKFNIRKGKIDSNVLVMSMNNDEDQYRRHFEKNIAVDRCFPPTLQNIPRLEVERPQRYYNQFHDIIFEKFIRKYNKRTIFQKFAAKAPYLFPENYSADELEDSENITAGKIFVHPPEKVLDRLIYRIGDYKLSAAVRSDFSHIRMDLNQMLILAFLARKYVRKFGNEWKSVTQFIAMHPVFSNHHITQEVVQEVYQLVAKFDLSDPLAEINLWDKKILPFDYYGCYNYAEFGEKLYYPGPLPRPTRSPEIDTEDESQFDFERYEEMISESPQEPELDEVEALEEEYRQFALPVFERMVKSNHNFLINREDNFQRIRNVLDKFQPSTEKIPYMPEDRDRRENLNKVLDQLTGSAKGSDFKAATPFRKKKNINERNNQLVKILQALRNKNVGVPNQGMPKKPEEANKAFPQSSAPKSAPTASTNPVPAPAPKQTDTTDQKKTIQKSPEKGDKKQLGAPPKKDRKSKDGEDKKG